MNFRKSGNKWVARIDLRAGETSICELPDAGLATLALSPGAGGAVTVSFTISSSADIEAGTALWAPAEGLGPAGVVSVLMLDTLGSTLTAIRLTATGADARMEVAQ